MTAIISAPTDTVSHETADVEAIDDTTPLPDAGTIPLRGPGDGEIKKIPLHKIAQAPHINPRQQFDEQHIANIADSMKRHGLMQPILVRPVDSFFVQEGRQNGRPGFFVMDRRLIKEGANQTYDGPMPFFDDEEDAGNFTPIYEIVIGECRFRAATKLDWYDIEARVRILTEDEAQELALIENVKRQDLNVIERALGVLRLLDRGRTITELAAQIGISRSELSNQVRLLKLPADVLELVKTGRLEQTHARALLRWQAYPQACSAIAARAVANGATAKELEKAGVPFDYYLQQDGLIGGLSYDDRFAECKECPFGAYFEGQYGNRFCFNPEHLKELRQAAKQKKDAVIQAGLDKAIKAAESQRETQQITNGAAPSPGKKGAAGKDNAPKRNIVRLDSLSYGSYVSIGANPPEGCCATCECRGVAVNSVGEPVQICTRPRRYSSLEGKQTKAKKAVEHEALQARLDTVLGLLEEMPSRTLITALAARVLQHIDGEALTAQAQALGLTMPKRAHEYTDKYYHRLDAIKSLTEFDATQLLHLAMGALVRHQVTEGFQGRSNNTAYLDFLQAPVGEKPAAIPCAGCGLELPADELREHDLVVIDGTPPSDKVHLCETCSTHCGECGGDIAPGQARALWIDGDLSIVHDECGPPPPGAPDVGEADDSAQDAPQLSTAPRKSLDDLTAGTLPCEGCSMAVQLSRFEGGDIITTPDGRRVTAQNHVLSADGAHVWCDRCGRGQWDRSLPHGIELDQADADPAADDAAARELAEEIGEPDLPAPDPNTGLVRISHYVDADDLDQFVTAGKQAAKVLVKGCKLWAAVQARRWRDNRLYVVVAIHNAPRKTHVVSVHAYEAVPHKDLSARAFDLGKGYEGVGLMCGLTACVLQGPEIVFSLEPDAVTPADTAQDAAALETEPQHPAPSSPYVAPGPTPDYPVTPELDPVIAAGGVTEVTEEDDSIRLTCWTCSAKLTFRPNHRGNPDWLQFYRDHRPCKAGETTAPEPTALPELQLVSPEPAICAGWLRIDPGKTQKDGYPVLNCVHVNTTGIRYLERQWRLTPGYTVETVPPDIRWIVSPSGRKVTLQDAIERGIATEIPIGGAADEPELRRGAWIQITPVEAGFEIRCNHCKATETASPWEQKEARKRAFEREHAGCTSLAPAKN